MKAIKPQKGHLYPIYLKAIFSHSRFSLNLDTQCQSSSIKQRRLFLIHLIPLKVSCKKESYIYRKKKENVRGVNLGWEDVCDLHILCKTWSFGNSNQQLRFSYDPECQSLNESLCLNFRDFEESLLELSPFPISQLSCRSRKAEIPIIGHKQTISSILRFEFNFSLMKSIQV